MNPIKQIMLYKEITSMPPCTTSKNYGTKISPYENIKYNTVCLENSELLLMASHITKCAGDIETVSYRLSIKNNGMLRHAPRLYSNESFLARAVYKHLMHREMGAIGFIKPYIR